MVVPNRVKQQFTVDAPNKVWVTDITYVRTLEGWLYVAVVMDLYSKRIVGWSMQPTMHRDLVIQALFAALWRRNPKGPRSVRLSPTRESELSDQSDDPRHSQTILAC